MSQIYENARAVMDEVKHAVTGKDDCIQKTFAAILAGGHILSVQKAVDGFNYFFPVAQYGKKH